LKRTLRIPIVSILLVAANLAAAYALAWDPFLANNFGFSPEHPSFLTIFTCLFLHENLFHLLGNMVFLAAVGGSLELATGSLRFAFVYFVSGLVGVLFHYLAFRHSLNSPPLVGASAAVAGCAGYYVMRYTTLRIPVAPKISLSVLWVTLIWLLLQIVGTIVRFGDPNASIAYWAHIGGFLAGVVLSFIFRAPDVGQDLMDKEVLDKARWQGPSAQLMTSKHLNQTNPNDINILHQWIEAATKLEEPDEESQALIKLIEVCGEDERIDCYARLCQIRRASALPALRRLTFAKECRSESPATAILLCQSIAIEPENPSTPEALFLLADIYYEMDPRKAKSYLNELEAYQDHPATTRARARGWIT